MKSGKYTLGYKTCLKTLRSGKGEHQHRQQQLQQIQQTRMQCCALQHA
jgi:ribosomal protein L30E